MKADFERIQRDVIQLLDEKLPAYLSYHNTRHTLYVLRKSEDIARKEGVSEANILLIKLAALYHDVGFTQVQKNHEEKSCEIARKQLKASGYSTKDIEVVCGIIMATKIPQNPQNHLEQIVADADLEYLATNRFELMGENLYKELKHFNPDLTREEWNKLQVAFISQHNYHTTYCRRYKSFRKKRNLARLQESMS